MAGATPGGIWNPSNGDFFYVTQSLFNKTAGDTYTYTVPYTGAAEVSLWWTIRPSRYDNVHVEVWDGDVLLDDTVRVNQLDDGGQWNPIGIYDFTDTARVVVVSSGTCSTCADAVKLSTPIQP